MPESLRSPGLFSTTDAALALGAAPAPLYAGQRLGPNDCLYMAWHEDMPADAATSRRIFCYDAEPETPYLGRARAYDEADLCVAADRTTVERLSLLHPRVLRLRPGAMPDAEHVVAALHAPPASGKDASRPAARHRPRAIVFVVHHFSVGGLENVVLQLMLLTRAHGHRPLLAYEGSVAKDGREQLERHGLECRQLPQDFIARRDFLERTGAQLVNAHYATLLYEECRSLGIPFMQTIHNMYVWLRGSEAEHWRRMDAFTSAYVAVSANAARVADVRLGLDVSKMIVIPNGGRLSARHRPVRAREELLTELDIPPTGKVFVNVASIARAKGQMLCVYALERALREREELYLVFVGNTLDVEYAERLGGAITRLGVERQVRLAGFRHNIFDFLDIATAAVFPSYYEGWSLAVTEAASHGLPVIATDVGGAAEQLRGYAGAVLLPAPLAYPAAESGDLGELMDEHHQERICGPLARALLDAASGVPSDASAPAFLMDEDSVGLRHIRVMNALLEGTPVRDLRAGFCIPQRQTTERM